MNAARRWESCGRDCDAVHSVRRCLSTHAIEPADTAKNKTVRQITSACSRWP